MMAQADVLTRLVTVYLRGRSVAAKATPVVAASVPADAGACVWRDHGVLLASSRCGRPAGRRR